MGGVIFFLIVANPTLGAIAAEVLYKLGLHGWALFFMTLALDAVVCSTLLKTV
jgi:hypothetical protein